MIILLYRWKIKQQKEKQFEDNWAKVTEAIRENCGSYGSRLHLSSTGDYIGYAQWPNTETRERCEIGPQSIQARQLMREAIEHSYPEEILEIKMDLLEHNQAIL